MSTIEGSGSIVKDGLVICLDISNSKSYTSGSTTWNDISRYANMTANLLNGPTFNSEYKGNLSFDGANDFVSGSSSFFSFGTSDFTINYWFYINSFIAPSPTVVDLRVISNDFGYADFISSATNTFRLYWNNMTQYTSTKKIYEGNWYNILVTRSGTTLSVYINGLLDGTKTDSSNLSSSQLKIGRNVNVVGTSYFNGKFVNLLVYNKSFTENEAKKNFNATRNRFGV